MLREKTNIFYKQKIIVILKFSNLRIDFTSQKNYKDTMEFPHTTHPASFIITIIQYSVFVSQLMNKY